MELIDVIISPANMNSTLCRIAAVHRGYEIQTATSQTGHNPKPNGKKRPLGIPIVVDRVVQQATAQALVNIFDPTLSNPVSISDRTEVRMTQWSRH